MSNFLTFFVLIKLLLSVKYIFLSVIVCESLCVCVGSAYEILFENRSTLQSEQALAMDYGWTHFIVILPRDPLICESVQRSKNGTTKPDRVFACGLVIDVNLSTTRAGPLHLV